MIFVWILICIALYVNRRVKKTEARERGGKTVWSAFWFTIAVAVHVFLVIHVKVVLSPVDCNWCRKGVMCLDENTLVECWTDDPTWQKMMVMATLAAFLCYRFDISTFRVIQIVSVSLELGGHMLGIYR